MLFNKIIISVLVSCAYSQNYPGSFRSTVAVRKIVRVLQLYRCKCAFARCFLCVSRKMNATVELPPEGVTILSEIWRQLCVLSVIWRWSLTSCRILIRVLRAKRKAHKMGRTCFWCVGANTLVLCLVFLWRWRTTYQNQWRKMHTTFLVLNLLWQNLRFRTIICRFQEWRSNL